MEGIRLATPEEIESIKQEADLGPGCTVVTLPGEKPIHGVIRIVQELDPVFYNGASNQRKALFVWSMENAMRLQGVPFYYFNVPANDEFADYRTLVTNPAFGAQQVSKEPEFRFKKTL